LSWTPHGNEDALTADRRATLTHLYQAFNARDADGAIEHLAPGVDWPDVRSNTRIHGRDAVRAYWLKQWKEIDPRVEPMKMDFARDGTVRVLVDQLVRSLDGKILSNKQIQHVYEFDGPFIARMTVVDFDRPADDDEE
jgi:ketosteroid isomerase-like protein